MTEPAPTDWRGLIPPYDLEPDDEPAAEPDDEPAAEPDDEPAAELGPGERIVNGERLYSARWLNAPRLLVAGVLVALAALVGASSSTAATFTPPPALVFVAPASSSVPVPCRKVYPPAKPGEPVLIGFLRCLLENVPRHPVLVGPLRPPAWVCVLHPLPPCTLEQPCPIGGAS